MLKSMKGVGNVEVMIHFENEGELVPALNVNKGTNETNEKDNAGGTRNTTQVTDGKTVVMSNSGTNNEALILKKNNPEITGVMVIAQGAEVAEVKYDIIKAVCALFNLTNNKVYVYPMK
jgi:stage III sporulation protein AG